MKHVVLFLLAFTFFACKESKTETTAASVAKESIENSDAETLAIYDFDGISPLLNQKDDKVHVVNFWATWCKPCIKELPYFEAVRASYDEAELEVLLVSLDFPKQFESKLKPYIKEHNLQSTVVALDDPDMNTWIPKVSENWSGSIPATIIYNNEKRVFYERSFTKEELEIEIQKFIK